MIASLFGHKEELSAERMAAKMKRNVLKPRSNDPNFSPTIHNIWSRFVACCCMLFFVWSGETRRTSGQTSLTASSAKFEEQSNEKNNTQHR